MNLWRQLFYSLSPQWRIRARAALFRPYDWLVPPGDYHGLPLPPRGKIFTGAGNFIETAERLTKYLRLSSNLHAHSRVVDIGCGLGRMAYPISQIISPPGSYFGFDPMPDAVDWCRNQFKDYPHFTFCEVDLFNDLYNRKGAQAQEFTFPLAHSSADVILAISVFTHLLPEETVRYLAEIKRILAPGGHAFVTFFLLPATPVSSSFSFRHAFGHYSLMSRKVARANVAYQYPWLEEQLQNCGLIAKTKQLGSWQQGGPAAWDFQDILVLTHGQ